MYCSFRKCLLLLIPSLMLMSCAKINYNYNSVSYESPELALAAQKAEYDEFLSKMTPTRDPIHGSAIIVIPTVAYNEKNFVSFTGFEPSGEMKRKMADYTGTLLYNRNRYECEAVEKRRIFDKVTFASSDNPENSYFDEDFALLYFKKDGAGRWFLKRKKDSSNLISIEAMSTSLPPIQGMSLWLNNVEKAAKSP
jgi:hypothetical protein